MNAIPKNDKKQADEGGKIQVRMDVYFVSLPAKYHIPERNRLEFFAIAADICLRARN
jgi:hypothetical protein